MATPSLPLLRPRALTLLYTQPLRLPLFPPYIDVTLDGPFHMMSQRLHMHIIGDQLYVDCGLLFFNSRGYANVCTMTNHIVYTDLSLWTPLLTEDACRQACEKYSSGCSSCGSTEQIIPCAPHPSKMSFLSLARSSSRTILTAPCLYLGKRLYDIGIARGLSIETKVVSDATCLGVAPHAPTIIATI